MMVLDGIQIQVYIHVYLYKKSGERVGFRGRLRFRNKNRARKASERYTCEVRFNSQFTTSLGKMECWKVDLRWKEMSSLNFATVLFQDY